MGNKTNITETEHDPHPSSEEHYERQERPGGARPPRDRVGTNPAVHDGAPQKRPDNAENRGTKR
ncbi:hypothetical protein SAMN06295905_1423 [Devosia lucknowensis]|uniref:Uncharacterized protein n=1 Tax=Devosia lucknowensis TaxID=1096929 RepID=A0A1Y6EYS3_9HYPH|nr:hypothetical protein [Devosia lucknowensis]SMQ66210.1 hypothetical protein SAMN06295905_1423 [Devosia lucknowensis]